ncbi:MAG TPA: malto-oligosyltrehalose trehalohydrolase [Bryobacteraceae bacterium]|jgi:maltooligosyltrehalose trehalohydrolase|nr:malto-oligosyltrehalose trehalohydrolase [Bryobacteraceae bacterium]
MERDRAPALLPVGADYLGERGTRFRTWAPGHRSVQVVFEKGSALSLEPEEGGYFSGFASHARPGTRYLLKLDNEETHPDPASRFQPEGPHGYSEVVDPRAFAWSDGKWRGVELEGQVIYEMHLGTFTETGTWKAAMHRLPYLAETGVTLLEIMPVADFPGRFGWGYDGVLPYAPASIYGRPDDMRAFVDRAHQLGLGVILDVVYNHLGPDGNCLPNFSPHYLSRKHKTDWGAAINFDGEQSGSVREFFRENAAYWIREFHLDGLRLDATQDIHDESKRHILAEMGEAARAAAGDRSIVLIGENEPQQTRLIRPVVEGGYGLDALWNDDFHHSAMVALTGRSEAYYTDYRGSAQEFISALKYGYLFQGQYYKWQKKRRGTSNLGLPRAAMVTFIQNHDQIANSARGQRVHELSAPGAFRALTAVTLLGPGTPMLFQGEEFAASAPFLYFADHKPELAEGIRKGRAEFLDQWRSLRTHEMLPHFADPCSEETFLRSKLDWSEVEKHADVYSLHRDLLALRRTDPVIAQQGRDGIDGAVLSNSAFVLRYFTSDYANDRLLVVNLGVDLDFNPAPEPLLAPPADKRWAVLWSSEDIRYGGSGTAPLDSDENWKIPGRSAVLLYPAEAEADPGASSAKNSPIP